eukprot:gene56071-31262_t
MATMEEELARIGTRRWKLVRTKEFREKQENKLSYTTIHQEYEEQVEGELRRGVGDECLARVCAGLEKYVDTRDEDATRTPEIMETIDLLSSLGDFEQFKGVAVVEIAGVMDMIKDA